MQRKVGLGPMVVRTSLSVKLTNLFSQLRKECIFGYSYNYWEGSEFENKLRFKPAICEQFNLIQHLIMKAYISYSLNDNEMYILTELVKKLNTINFSVEGSSPNNEQLVSGSSIFNIQSSHLFIGIICTHSDFATKAKTIYGSNT